MHKSKRPTKCVPDAGALRVRQSQAVFYALAFFWLDGFAVPALVAEPVETQRRYPLSGTMAQTVGQPKCKTKCPLKFLIVG